MELKEIYIGAKFYLKGKGTFIIEDTLKSKRFYKKLGLPIFKETKKKVKDETDKGGDK